MTSLQLFLQKIGKRRLLVFVFIIILIAVVLFMLLRTKPIPTGSSYTASDIVTTNTQQPQTTSSGKVVFFTGSNQAQIVPSDSTTPKTLSLITEAPFQNPLKSRYDEASKSLLLSVEYTGQDQLFALPGVKTGIQWLVLQKGKQPSVINPKQNQTLDATIQSGVVYGLTVEDNKTYNLYSYSITNKATVVLARDILSNSVVGATKSSVVTREPNGTVVVYSNKGKRLNSAELTGSVLFDTSTGRFVNINDDISRKSYKITVFDAETGKKINSVKSPYRYAYASNGYIFGVSKKIRPSDIITYDQETLQASRHPLILKNSRSKDSITSIMVINKEPFTLGLFGSSDSLQLASENSEFINSLPEYKYPYFSSDKVNGTVIESSPGSINVALTTDVTNITQSLTDLKTSCTCDVNQLFKTWFSNDTLAQEFE